VRASPGLNWQSSFVLAAVAPWCFFAVVRYVSLEDRALQESTWIALGISLALALLVILLRAATPAAALTGGLINAALTLQNIPWYRSAFPALLTVCALTFSATRFGRSRKQQLGVAEDRRGRNAAQIAANLGMAGMAAGVAVSLSHASIAQQRVCLVAAIAALGEATADTLASELGAVLGGRPYLITTFRQVAPGTDGAISVAGSAIGILGAAVLVALATATLGFHAREAIASGAGAVVGLFADSLLGATAERRGWLNNDAVNFLSTATAAAAGIALA
jgi:uncharacterized protein (TIGR00297 family)